MKIVLMILLSLTMVACTAHDEQYYSTHPDALKQALNQCPETAPKGLRCDQLKTIAIKLNTLIDELRTDPQKFGQKILALQEAIAQQKPALRQPLVAELKERLVIVKWLESPGH